MKSHISSWSALGLAVAVPVWLLGASVARADQKAGASGGGTTSSTSSSGGGGGGHASSGGSGGGHASSGGGGGHASSGGGGGHAAASGSGTAHAGAGAGSRAQGPSDSSAGSAVPRGSAGTAATGAGTKAGYRATYRNDPTTRKGGDTVPPYSRPRDGNPIVGQAVPRDSRPPATGGGPIYVPGGYWSGYYPWGYGGLGVAGFYSSFYDPCYDPYDYGFACGGGYGGYGSYSGYGGYGSYGGSGSYGAYGGTSDPQASSGSAEEGSIHLKIKPRDASVFVDGYYVGLVDDFDGVFQKLHMEAGPHRIEVRAPGYETLTFDVRVEPDKATTYKGELRKIQ